MVGQAWLANPLAAAPAVSNGFTATVNGATRVALDLGRMAIKTSAPIAGRVTNDHALELRLIGNWTTPPAVRVNGAPAPAALAGGTLVINLPAGTSAITVA
jgi:hypothetical protein